VSTLGRYVSAKRQCRRSGFHAGFLRTTLNLLLRSFSSSGLASRRSGYQLSVYSAKCSGSTLRSLSIGPDIDVLAAFFVQKKKQKAFFCFEEFSPSPIIRRSRPRGFGGLPPRNQSIDLTAVPSLSVDISRKSVRCSSPGNTSCSSGYQGKPSP
jgi:hypothetical protein